MFLYFSFRFQNESNQYDEENTLRERERLIRQYTSELYLIVWRRIGGGEKRNLRIAYFARNVFLQIDRWILKKDVQRTFVLSERMAGHSRRQKETSDCEEDRHHLLINELFEGFPSIIDEFIFENAVVTTKECRHLSFPSFAGQGRNNDLWTRRTS